MISFDPPLINTLGKDELKNWKWKLNVPYVKTNIWIGFVIFLNSHFCTEHSYPRVNRLILDQVTVSQDSQVHEECKILSHKICNPGWLNEKETHSRERKGSLLLQLHPFSFCRRSQAISLDRRSHLHHRIITDLEPKTRTRDHAELMMIAKKLNARDSPNTRHSE